MQQDRVRIGISSACFFPTETIHAVKKLASWNIPNIEIFFNSPRELKEDYVQELAQICKQAGTNVVSVHPFSSGSEPLYFFSEYPGRFEDGLEIYRSYFQAAKILGAQLLVFHGDSPYSKMPLEKGFEQIKQMDLLAQREYGVSVAYENVVRCRGKEPEYFAMLKEYYPQMKFVLDIKQALRSGRDPMDYIEYLGKSIVHVHISDSNEKKDCLPVGLGKMDLDLLLQRLIQKGFTGNILQELYRDSYDCEEEIMSGYQKLQKIIGAILTTNDKFR